MIIVFFLIINFYMSLNLNLFDCRFNIVIIGFNKIMKLKVLCIRIKLGCLEKYSNLKEQV